MHVKSRTPLVVVGVLFAVAGITYWVVVAALTGGLQILVTFLSLDGNPETVDLGWPNRWLIVGISFAIALAVQLIPVRPETQPQPGAFPPPPPILQPRPPTHTTAPPQTAAPTRPAPPALPTTPPPERPTTIADLPAEPPTYREF